MRYNWQQDDWPEFRYDLSSLEKQLIHFTEQTGQVSGMIRAMPEALQRDAILDIMVTEAVKTSEIEGEYISRQDVMLSIRNQMGINTTPEQVSDDRAKGAAMLMLKIRDTFQDSLSEYMLFDWHTLLLQWTKHITVGGWRTHIEPMQVVSGVQHKPTIHFEAPPSHTVPKEMEQYISWFNQTARGQESEIPHAVVRSAIAHIYFESIHPFEDGNGRIGRALSEKALAQGAGYPSVISLSKAIEAKKKSYYDALEQAQSSNEITAWIEYFVYMAMDAQKDAEELITFILKKARFFDRYADQLNEAQTKVLQRMLQEGEGGFIGGMSAKKYIAITGVSKATATRHLQYLSGIGAIIPIGSGRASHYEINLEV